jgi:two-component system sensor histidine kinase/response regulator
MIDVTFKKANILIVDDQDANIDILLDLLEIQGYLNTKTTTDPREVIGLFSSFKPDLILLDLSMPYLSGFEVMDQLKKFIPTDTYIAILVLTADGTMETKQRALSSGASDFVAKPFDLIEVGLRVKNLLYSSYLKQQLQNQNQILEEKVRERTKELELSNNKLIIAKDKAEESDRLKTAFLNNISHEIRTPLNGILGFGTLLTKPEIPKEEKQEFLNNLNKSSNRLMKTVTDMMDMSLINSGNMTVTLNITDISLLLKNIYKQNQEEAENKMLDYKLHIPSKKNIYNVNTDSELLQKALSNIVDNAIKFTNKGSVSLGFELLNNEIEFFVKDTGRGIEKKYLENVFKIFTQENNSKTRANDGNGLGLTVAKELIQLLDGKIRLVSTKNQGTTVFLSIPNSSALSTSKPPKTDNYCKLNDEHAILIAEDDELNFFVLNNFLKDDHKVIRANNGQEAVDLCEKHPEIALVLMDISMPIMNGIEATQIIKSYRNNLPIVAVTAHTSSEMKLKIKNAGCDDYCSKPINKTNILSIVQKYIRQ